MTAPARAGTHTPLARQVFLSGQVTSLLGEGISLLAIPLLVLQITHNPVAAALAAAPRTLGYLLAGIPAGPIVDRASPWTVLVLADLVRTAVFIALYLLVVLGSPSAWTVIGLATIAGAATVFFDTALAVAVQDAFTGDGLIRANAQLEMATQASVVLGPAAVGVLTVVTDLSVSLLVTAATFLLSLASLAAVTRARRSSPVPRSPATPNSPGATGIPPSSVPDPSPAETLGKDPGEASGKVPSQPRSNLWREFREGLIYLRTHRLLLALTIVQTVINLCLAVEKLLAFFVTQTLASSTAWASAVLAAGGIGGILGAATAPRATRRSTPLRVVACSVAAIGAALVVMAAAITPWWLAAGNLVLVWATALPSVVIRTLRQRIVPRELLGRVTSTSRMIFLAVTPVGAALAGLVTEWSGGSPRSAFAAAGALILITIGAAWRRSLRHYDHDHDPDPAAPAPGRPPQRGRAS